MTHGLDDSTGFEEPVADSPELTVAKEQNALAITEDMDRVKNSLNEFDRVSAGLADLEARYPKDAIYPVETTKGMKDAVEHRAAYRDPRVMVEKARKMAKAPLLTLGKSIDARAAWITGKLEEGEKPVDQQIKAEERRREEEREARAAAEAARILKIQEALAAIGEDVLIACGKTSAEVRDLSERMHATLPDPDVFKDMLPQAKEAWRAGIEKLETVLKAKLWDEAEQERLAKERAEAEVRRQQEVERLEAERIENQRVADEQRKAAAAMAEERRLFEAEKAALQAEKDRLAQQEAERHARIAARFDRYEQLLAFDAEHASELISTAIARLTSNAPSVDTYGDRLAEAQHKHTLVLDHLRGVLPLAVEREQSAEVARVAEEAAAAAAAEAAARATAAPAVIPVAPPVAQVRQPDPAPAPADERVMKLSDINEAFEGRFSLSGDAMSLLGFESLPAKGSTRLYRASDFDRICNAIADHAHTVRARRSLEKAA